MSDWYNSSIFTLKTSFPSLFQLLLSPNHILCLPEQLNSSSYSYSESFFSNTYIENHILSVVSTSPALYQNQNGMQIRIEHTSETGAYPSILANLSESIDNQPFEVYILSNPIEENTDLISLNIAKANRVEDQGSESLMSLRSSKFGISELSSSVMSEKDGAMEYSISNNIYRDMELSHMDRESLVSENESETYGRSDVENLDRDEAPKLKSYITDPVLTKSEVLNCSVQGPELDEILTLSNLLNHYRHKLLSKSDELFNKYRLRQKTTQFSKLLLGIILGYFIPILFTKLSKNSSSMEFCSISTDEIYYEGNCINNIPFGRGTMVYSTGNIYIGDFIEGYKTGKGFMKFSNGSTYNGEFKEDLLSGKGVLEVNGNIYEGIFIDSKLEGQGKYLMTTGESYQGEFKENLKHGKGKLTTSHGDVYEGSFEKDKKHGDGVMKYASGEIYEGNWEIDMRNGKGKMIWKDGRYWDGKWKNDERSFWGEWGKMN